MKRVTLRQRAFCPLTKKATSYLKLLGAVLVAVYAVTCAVFGDQAVERISDVNSSVVTRPGQCLMNLAGITSGGKTVPGAAAVERHGLGDGYQTKWGLEIGHLREGANCVYRGFDFSTSGARSLEFHVSSGMQDSCMELYDADGEKLLGTVFCPCTGGWKKYQTVKFTLPDSASAVKELKIRFRHARKEDVPGWASLSQPPPDAVPGGAMVVVKRHHLKPSHVYTYHVEGLSKGGGLYVCDFAKGEVRRLVDAADGIVLDAQVSYDGKQILFSWKRTMSEPFEIWRVNVDGTGLEKVISGPCNNQNACWLPDGGIAFTSDRKPAFAYCWTSTSPVLYRADGDGKNVVRLSANYLTDFTPSVMGDGRILFSRWEYVDRPAIPIQSLWAIQPDGTGLSGVFGNRVLSPATFMFAHDVPGRPGEYLCIMTSHNGPCNGAVGLIDVSLGGNAQKAIRNLTPEVKVPPVEDGIRGNWVRGPYTTPYPVDGECYLVSRAGEVQLRRYDSSEAQTLLRTGADDLGWYSPQPLAPRAKPAVQRANVRKADAGPFAEVVVQDVYIGLEGHVKRGEVKRIAVVQEMEKDIRAETSKRQFGFQFPVVSCGATYAPKRVWGFADVEADGSAHFLAPANVPIYFLPLDAEGRAVQRMRTFTHFMPGERQSCIGCHADRNYVSISPAQIGKSIAVQRPAARLVPPTWGSDNGFSFPRNVQPVLNRYCVKCHSGGDSAPEPELTGDRTDYFNVAYENLARRGTGAESGGDVKAYMKNFGKNPYTSWIPTYNGLEENILWITPKTWGSPVSKLSQIVASGHPGKDGKPRVKLTDDERLRIHMWIDLNVPYYGTSQSRQNDLRGCRRVLPQSLLAVKADIEKRKGVKLPHQFYVRYDRPERNPWLKEGLAKGIFTGTDDPDYKLLLGEIEKARPMLDLRNDVDIREVIGAVDVDTVPVGGYPYAPAALNDVKVTGGFWLPRIETNRLVTVKTDFAKCEETGRLASFEKAGRREKGGFKGVSRDSDVYKVIEGAAYTLAQRPNPELDRYLDGLIAKIASAQEPDGYLYTARTLGHKATTKGPKPFSRNRDSSELYNVGHLYEAAVAHYEVTGKRTLLDVAIKNADLVARTFGLGEGQCRDVPGHEEIEIGLCRLYRATGDAKYLKLAQHFIDMRGRKDLRPIWGADCQDHAPVLLRARGDTRALSGSRSRAVL